MPLHDHEERRLADIERHLTEEDPRLARRFTTFRAPAIAGIVALVVGSLMLLPTGLVTMVIGVQTQSPLTITGGAVLTAVMPVAVAWYFHRRSRS